MKFTITVHWSLLKATLLETRPIAFVIQKYQLTLWTRVLKNLMVAQLVKNFPAPFMVPEHALLCSQEPGTRIDLEPVQSTPLCHALFKIHFNVVLPSTPSSHVWRLLFRISKYCNMSRHPHLCFIYRPVHPQRFDHRNNVWLKVVLILQNKTLKWVFTYPTQIAMMGRWYFKIRWN